MRMMPGMPPPFSAAVLAGGRSTRFGRDKAGAPYHGRPLARWVLESLHEADDRFVVANRPYAYLGVPAVRDRVPGAGPLAGLHAALLHARHPWVAVAACDLPGLTPAYWRLLLTQAWACQAVVVDWPHGGLEPLAALYHRRALTTVAARLAAGAFSLHGLVRQLDTRFVPVRRARLVGSARVLVNLNRPHDLQRPA